MPTGQQQHHPRSILCRGLRGELGVGERKKESQWEVTVAVTVIVIVATVFVSVRVFVSVTVTERNIGETGFTTNDPPLSGVLAIGTGAGLAAFLLPVACAVALLVGEELE